MMGIAERIFIESLQALAVRLHVETCKECRKKYEEIVKHALEDMEKHASYGEDKG